MPIAKLDTLREKLKSLRLEHRLLDNKIDEMAQEPSVNSLDLQRLKKRKLQLKETIVKIESQLIPDMGA